MNAKRSRQQRRLRSRAETARDRRLIDANELVVDEEIEALERAERLELNVAADAHLGDLVDGLLEVGRIESRAAASKIEQVYRIVTHTRVSTAVTTSKGMRPWSQAATARRVAVSEIAAALRIPEPTAQGLIDEAVMLTERLPETLAALQSGAFSYRHAKSIVTHARSLPDAIQAEFEASVLPAAGRLTFSKFDRKARTIRERMDATTIAERHQRSLVDREISYEPARDGMGWLHLYTSAHTALAAYNRADEMARSLGGESLASESLASESLGGEEEAGTGTGSDERTLVQKRADVAIDLLLDGTIEGRPEFQIRPSVVVTVPVLAMLGHKNAKDETELPVLEGHGPIDVDTAIRLAGAAKSWLRVLTHPETGTTLSVGRDRYKVPAALRAYLKVRDATCRKPGCNQPVAHCDIDHTQEWQHGGQTAHDNLAHMCPLHHNEKHHTPVTLKHLANGDLEWTLPSGHRYVSEPADGFVYPEDMTDADFGTDFYAA